MRGGLTGVARHAAGLAACLAAFAACQALSSERVALVVGNADYRNVPALANPVNDAEDMAALLRRLGFSVTAGRDLTDAAMEDRVRAFSRRARGAEVALFFYAGHGLQVDGLNYLVPVDARLADEADLPFEAIAMNLVLEQMRAATNLVFLDACRDNPFARGWAAAGRSTSAGRGLTRVGESGGSGLFIAFATDPDRIAADGEGRNSPFTAALKRHIETPGLEVNALLTEVRRTVLASTGNVQRPWSNSSLSEAFYFVPSASPPAADSSGLAADAPDPEAETWLQIRGTTDAGLLERYLDRYPNGRYRDAAEARLATLRQPFTVLVEPSEARVRILNIEPRYSAGMKLQAGEYEVEASAEGYATKTETVVHGAAPTVHRLALSRSGQPFTIEAEPAHARIRLVGRAEAYRPGMLLASGPYRVEASAEGYETATETVAHGATPTLHRLALRKAGPLAGEKFRDCPECPEMAVVPAGSFMMGGRYGNERPVHEVTIGAPFAVGVYEVTFAEWDACVRDGGCRGRGDGYTASEPGWGRGRRPVINVGWDDAKRYVQWLSRKTGRAYRLLSESEWEYAARAGTETAYSWGDEIGVNRANCSGCGSQWDDDRTAPVGSFDANAWGLHDMHGNVYEWVEDCWNDSYAGAPADGSAWLTRDCDERVLRGGSWYFKPSFLRAAFRYRFTTGFRDDIIGFRVARTLAP